MFHWGFLLVPTRLPTEVVPIYLLMVSCFQIAESAGAEASDGSSSHHVVTMFSMRAC